MVADGTSLRIVPVGSSVTRGQRLVERMTGRTSTTNELVALLREE